MAESLLEEIVRIRRLVTDAAKEHDIGKDIGSRLNT